jgi:hypothetical protein
VVLLDLGGEVVCLVDEVSEGEPSSALEYLYILKVYEAVDHSLLVELV